MVAILSHFLRNESGATAIEYALIASLVSLVIIAGLRTIGTRLSAKFNAIGNQLTMHVPAFTDWIGATALC